MEPLLAIAILLVFTALYSIERRISRLWRLEMRVAALLKQPGNGVDEFEGVPDEVLAAVDRGDTAEAVKLLRASVGIGPSDAKEFVAELVKRRQK